MPPLVAPSILAADFGNLQRDCELVNNSKADWFHIDVMDGQFVPNISFGTPVIKAIQKIATKPLDIHLMIVDPDRYLDLFIELGASILTVHIEVCNHLHRSLNYIRSKGVKAGIAINPHTDVNSLSSIITEVDLICIMSVNPGFGGQKFINSTFSKVQDVKNLIKKKSATTLIEIDGGVTNRNAKELVTLGADILVAGSFVFSAEDPHKAIDTLKALE